MREETNYYRNSDLCPHYYPGDENDPYPGQPFFEDVEKPKTYHYSHNLHAYNAPVEKPKTNHYSHNLDTYNAPVEKPKTNHYSHNLDIYGYPNIHSNNRRQETGIKAANKTCRRMTNKGNEARCDENIEVRNEFLEQLDNIRVACGNDRCDFK